VIAWRGIFRAGAEEISDNQQNLLLTGGERTMRNQPSGFWG
jgi:hypothetical protein